MVLINLGESLGQNREEHARKRMTCDPEPEGREDILRLLTGQGGREVAEGEMRVFSWM